MKAAKPRVVIVGGGFAGLSAARVLGKRQFPVTLIDRNNYHLFQPLLYQVATGFLAPGDIAAPLRAVVSRYQSVEVFKDEVVDIEPAGKRILARGGSYPYDILIVATGVSHSYFGHDEWGAHAPGLKSIEQAIDIRSRVLQAFEDAERTQDLEQRRKCLSFVIVGAGPTGVELAGAVAELARCTLPGEFRNFQSEQVRIWLIEGGSRALSSFHENISRYTEKTLKQLGIELRCNAKVTNIASDYVEIHAGDIAERIDAKTILWAAGVSASALSEIIATKLHAARDRSGKIKVQPDLSVPGYPDVFVLGDLASLAGRDGKPLPGVAPVALQQGTYVADAISRGVEGKQSKPFRYFDKGSMAVIGRGRAVAETWKLRLYGLPAWSAWALIHIYYLIEFENKIVVFFHWAWNYLTNTRGSRLITRG